MNASDPIKLSKNSCKEGAVHIWHLADIWPDASALHPLAWWVYIILKVLMPRFYFNVIAADGRLEDLEGSDLRDLAHARLEAIADARALMSEAILNGHDISSRHVEICNEAGDTLLEMSFKDTITPTA